MTEKVPCTKCSVLILPMTAEKNKGLCVPCSQGYDREEMKKAIEASKLRDKEIKKYQESIPGRYFSWLVAQECKSKTFPTLPFEDRVYYVVRIFLSGVDRDGIGTFYDRSDADYYDLILMGLKEIGALTCAALLEKSKNILFGEGIIPNSDERRKIIDARYEYQTEEEAESTLKELNPLFREISEETWNLLEQYAEKNRLYEKFAAK